MDITISGNSMDFDMNVKVAHKEIKCPTETIATSATEITFPNIAKTGDCMGDALREQKKDVSKFMIIINTDGTLTFKSDGWPPLKLKPAAAASGASVVAAPSGKYHAAVPFILDMDITISGNSMDFDMNVKVAHKEIKCPTETIATSATEITFPNIAKTGDCMGDALREQKKDVSKFMIIINTDGTLTFKSDGWPPLKLKPATNWDIASLFAATM